VALGEDEQMDLGLRVDVLDRDEALSCSKSVYVLEWRDHEVVGQLHAGAMVRAIAPGPRLLSG
jgi:hypothetical protein